MGTFKSDNPFEIELNKMLVFMENLKKIQTTFMATHTTLPTKDRILMIQKIQKDHKALAEFINKSKEEENFNSGIKFKLGNLKSRYESLAALWRKIERTL